MSELFMYRGVKMRDREIKEQLSIRLPIDWVDRIYQIAEKERKSKRCNLGDCKAGVITRHRIRFHPESEN